MRRFTIAASILAVVFVLLCPTLALAQAVAYAQIRGIVSDVTGAVVPGVQIKATHTDTGQMRTTISSADGTYVLPNLAVGAYTLEVSAKGFSNYVQSGIILQVGNNVQINVALQVGSVTEEMRVSADAAMVEMQDTSISQVVDQVRIVDLPLDGRQATDLILLIGGAVIAPSAAGRVVTSHDYPTSIGISVGGGQINGNNYLLDGGDHNDVHSNINLPFPFPDALQEFSVQTSGLSARYGLQPGSVVNAVTKSGSNTFHGGLFEFVRNGAFNARNFFAPAKDTLRRNQFGGTIGWPIIKDKIFGFSGFQATRTRTAPPQSIGYLPTQASLTGDFGTLESAACQTSRRAVTLVDPSNGQPFPNNFVSPSRFSAPSQALLKNLPVSTDPCGRLVYAVPDPSNENTWIGRVDWVKSAKHSLYARYFVLDLDNPPYYEGNLLTTTRAGLADRVQTVTLADQYSLSPTVVNAVHLTYNRLAINRAMPADMPNPVEIGVNMYNAHPHFIVLSVSNHFSIGGSSNQPAYYNRNQFHYAEDLDIMRGRHHLAFGGDARTIQMNTWNVSEANGMFTFNGTLTNDPLVDYFIGRPSTISQANPDAAALRQRYVGLYINDDIRATRRLNLNVGLRWEPSLPEKDTHGRGHHFSLPGFIAGQKTNRYVNAPPGLFYNSDPGIPEAYANGNWVGFAPRVGLAWDPSGSGKSSIRGSFGIFFSAPVAYHNKDFSQAPPWGNSVSLIEPIGGFANPYQGYPGGNPFPTPYPPGKNDAVFNREGRYVNMPLNLHHIYMEQWSLSLQRQVGANLLISASYQGNRGIHLRTSIDANYATYIPGRSTVANTNQRRLLYLLNPTAGAYFASITQEDDGAISNYHGLRLSVQHRFAYNFTLLSVYTYSHSLQDAQTIGNRLSTGSNMYQDPNNRRGDYSPTDGDLRHSFTTSFVYASPKFANRGVNTILGNWRPSFALTARTGFPFTPSSGIDNSLSGIGRDRPNVVGDPYVENMDSLVWINPAAFAPNPLGTFGNAGYNCLRGPGAFSVNANLTRVFQIRERHRLDLRFEFFNLLNHANFNNPGTNLRSATFGLIQSAGNPRILQFALKYSF